jgi:hypothetical protein
MGLASSLLQSQYRSPAEHFPSSIGIKSVEKVRGYNTHKQWIWMAMDASGAWQKYSYRQRHGII